MPHDGRLRMEDIPRQDISAITSASIGQVGSFRARVHLCRPISESIVLRQHASPLQGVIRVTSSTSRPATSTPDATPNGDDTETNVPPSDQNSVSELMIRFASRLSRETIVLVQGVAQKPIQGVKSTHVHDVEVAIQKVRLFFLTRYLGLGLGTRYMARFGS